MWNSNMILICLISFCIILALVVRIIQKPRVPYEKEMKKLLKLCDKKSDHAPERAHYEGFCAMISSLDISMNKKRKLLEFLEEFLPFFNYPSPNLYWFPPYDMEIRKTFLNQILTYLKTGSNES